MTIFEQIKERVPLVDAARRYGLAVDDKGKALCYFHAEKTPSMSFKGNYFKCFGCGEGGDVIKLVQHLTGAQRPIDAAKRLCEDYGLEFTYTAPRPAPNTPGGIPVHEYEAIKRVVRRSVYAKL